tara:strand:+ start:153 stop:392 length:240 start_codon:yes stop_codon:yes gene_type:complete
MTTITTENYEEMFFEAKFSEASSRIRELEYDCAELTKHNNTLLERCTKLASQKPTWPKGYKPKRYNNDGRISGTSSMGI